VYHNNTILTSLSGGVTGLLQDYLKHGDRKGRHSSMTAPSATSLVCIVVATLAVAMLQCTQCFDSWLCNSPGRCDRYQVGETGVCFLL